MILRLLLFFFGWGIRILLGVAGWRDPDFKRRLGEVPYRLQVRTRDRTVHQTYAFVAGRVLAEKHSTAHPDFLMEWQDSFTAGRALLRFSPAALLESVSGALLSGKLTVEYEVAPTVQLANIMKYLPRAIRKGRLES